MPENGGCSPDTAERSLSCCCPAQIFLRHARLGFWNEDYGLYGIEDSDFSSRLKAAGLKNLYMARSEQYIRHSHALYRENAHLDDEIRKTNGLSAEYRGMTEAPRRAIFLDRDGTLNNDTGYVHRKEDWHWLPGVVETLRRFHVPRRRCTFPCGSTEFSQ